MCTASTVRSRNKPLGTGTLSHIQDQPFGQILASEPARHMMFAIPGGVRMELIAPRG